MEDYVQRNCQILPILTTSISSQSARDREDKENQGARTWHQIEIIKPERPIDPTNTVPHLQFEMTYQ